MTTKSGISILELLLFSVICGSGALFLLFSSFVIKVGMLRQYAVLKLMQTFSGVCVGVFFGTSGTSLGVFSGLIFANALITGGAGALLLIPSSKVLLYNFQDSLSAIKKTISTQSYYVKFSTLENLVGIASVQIPILIMTIGLGDLGGKFFLAFALSQLPLSLVGTSITQIFNTQSHSYLESGSLLNFGWNVAKVSLVVCMLLNGAAWMLVHFFGDLIFGAQWSNLGSMLLLLVPASALQMTFAAISGMLAQIGRQDISLLAVLCSLLLRVSILLFSIYVGLNLVTVFSLVMSVSYLGLLLLAFRIIRKHELLLNARTN